jgi:hypothetical protein
MKLLLASLVFSFSILCPTPSYPKLIRDITGEVISGKYYILVPFESCTSAVRKQIRAFKTNFENSAIENCVIISNRNDIQEFEGLNILSDESYLLDRTVLDIGNISFFHFSTYGKVTIHIVNSPDDIGITPKVFW